MKIAVTLENNQVFQHFGHTEQFAIFTAEDDKIVNKEILSSNGQGHGALATLLSEKGIDVLICGGIGAGAQNALKEVGIELVAGASGDVEKVAAAYVKGDLKHDAAASCNHHHDKEHTCGSHSCGNHE